MRVGTNSNDILFSIANEDSFVFGLEGDDRIGDVDEFFGNDTYFGNEGDDRFYSLSGNDDIHGNTGQDIFNVWHHDGKITIDGGSGYDELNLIGFSDELVVTEYDNRTVLTDGACKVVVRDVEWFQ